MTQEEKVSVSDFISQIASKDYKNANSALEKTISVKLKERIRQALAKN